MRNRDEIQHQFQDAGEHAGERVRRYADGAAERAHHLYERSRELRARFGQRGDSYSRRLAHAAEDFADEANYHYRRLRRQASRHPVATTAIIAGTIGAFLLLRKAFSRDED